MNNILEVKNLSFYYDGRRVLNDISFEAEEGDYLGIVGPNGGGKTTLIKLILGLLKPASGEIKIFGTKIDSLKNRFWLGYVPQRITQLDYNFPATVEEIVKSGRTPRLGILRPFTRKDYEIVKKTMEITGVINYKNRLISDLSGGERQKVFIARVLASESKILILDEPTAEVDIASQEKFYAVLKKLNEELKLTILLVSHDVGVIAKETKTVLCLNRKLVCFSSPEIFLKEDVLEKLYGGGQKLIIHKHK